MADARRDSATAHEAASGDQSRPLLESWLRPGVVLSGKYRIEGLLGSGGMSIVAAARHLELDRPVAIKFLRGSRAENSLATLRLLREARAIAKMASDHVVRVFDVGVENDIPFIVMERLAGVDLSAELKAGPLTHGAAVDYLLQACEAVAEAHALGIVHRDLKPSNLFLSRGRGDRVRLKVLDFGISKWLDVSPDVEAPLATADRAILGTPAYASPEQLTHPSQVDARTDIWSLGVVLYQCLTGMLPFQGESIPKLCTQILTAGAATPPNRDCAPAELWAIVERCLQKAPEDRYENVIQLARALEALSPEPGRYVFITSESWAAPPLSPRRNESEPEPPRPSPRVAADQNDEALLSTRTELSREARTPRSSGLELGLRSMRSSAGRSFLPVGVAVLLLLSVGGAIGLTRRFATVVLPQEHVKYEARAPNPSPSSGVDRSAALPPERPPALRSAVASLPLMSQAEAAPSSSAERNRRSVPEARPHRPASSSSAASVAAIAASAAASSTATSSGSVNSKPAASDDELDTSQLYRR